MNVGFFLHCCRPRKKIYYQGGEAVDEAEKLKESEQQKDEENKKEKLKSCEEEKQASVLTTVWKFQPEWKQLYSDFQTVFFII